VWDALGVEALWAHQAAAIDLVRSGRSVAVATGTASGKSLCYQVPIAEAALGPEPATALAVFPTKALAQDQLRAVTALGIPGLVAATYDGDLTPEQRSWARTHATFLLTNPEMLHRALLPGHERFATFLHRLRHVVVDELHVLRGVFGSHVAHVLRRLLRLCHHYGSEPTFVFTSATVGSPGRLAHELTGLEVAEVLEDASPRGPRTLVLWDPAGDRAGPAATSGDGANPAGDAPSPPLSANRESAQLTSRAVLAGLRTITFCRSRRGTEVVAAEARRRLPRNLARKVRPYRAGYLVGERRDTEAELFAGDLVGVVATSALELGIDVGGLDACIVNGFPGTIASFRQQLGRAGRGTEPSWAALVAGDDQLDRYLLDHPDELWSRPPEPGVINPTNPHVLLPQLACAAYELPLSHADERWWPGLLDEGVRRLVLDGRLRVRARHRAVAEGPAAVWAGRGRPGDGVGLRRGADDEVRICSPDGGLVGTVDGGRACRQVHPGARYLHRGATYVVTDLDLDEGVATVEPTDDATWTQPRVDTSVEILATDDRARTGRIDRHLGAVRITSRVTGYRQIDARTGDVVGVHRLDLPAQHLETRGVWFTFDDGVLDAAGLAARTLPGTLHALEHAAIAMLPLFAICDRWDVGGVSTALQEQTMLPTVVVHDAHQGGNGMAELAFAAAEALLAATEELVVGCRCESGCPSCVQSPKCGNGNDPLDKAGAVALLRAVRGAPTTTPSATLEAHGGPGREGDIR
jgi:DEAD/DEAH box helicase domain-containing protein